MGGARWIRLADLATYLGVSQRTLRRAIQAGVLKAVRPATRHYTDERERKTGGGLWRVYEDDVKAYLETWRAAGKPVPGWFKWRTD